MHEATDSAPRAEPHGGQEMTFQRSILPVLPLVFLITSPGFAGQGNDLPSGPHYMLNIIAYDNCPAGDFLNSNRHMIAVQASFSDGLQGGSNAKPDPFLRNNDILLSPSPDDSFQVLDGNACDDAGAKFQLPEIGRAHV